MQIEKRDNTLILFDKDSYSKSFQLLLKESSKINKIPVALTQDLNHVFNSEKVMIDLLKASKTKTPSMKEPII